VHGGDDLLAQAERAAHEMALIRPDPFSGLVSGMALGLAAVLRNDTAAAAELYGRLEVRRGMVPYLDAGTYICVDRVLGLMSGTVGEPARAAAHFDDALAFNRKAGYRVDLAWTLHDYGALLYEHDQPGSRDRAVKMWDEALGIARELGMKPLIERIIGRKAILKA
jgi:hypothetical protein